jgi:hypothetical protein
MYTITLHVLGLYGPYDYGSACGRRHAGMPINQCALSVAT